jgi:hypothetical protein
MRFQPSARAWPTKPQALNKNFMPTDPVSNSGIRPDADRLIAREIEGSERT